MEWYFIVLLSACFLAGADLFMKKALYTDHAMEFIMTASLLVIIFLLPFISFMDFSFPPTYYLLIFLKALFASGAWLFFVKSIKHLELSQAIPLKNLSSLYVVILAFFILGETLSFLQLAGILVLIFGAALLELEKDIFHFITKIKILPRKYLGFILFSLLLGACCAILDKIILKEVPILPFTFFNFAFLFCIYFIISNIRYEGYKDITFVLKKTTWLVIGFAFFMLTADFLHFTAVAIPGVYISLIIPIRRLGTLISTVIGGRLFHEHNIGIRTMASATMLVGVLMLVW